MVFDYTKGKKANYMVMYYYGLQYDRVYFHYYDEAKKDFDRGVERGLEKGQAISLYDLNKDVRKAYKRF